MSSICTLGISGIRSYSPDRQEVIHFERPVTLILGKNGSGKTTIFECLKMATAGSFPPGTNNGKAFVTDMSLVGKQDVSSVIKLKFVAANRAPVLAIRSFNYRKRGEKYQFKQVEQMLKLRQSGGSAPGEIHTINCNVAQMDMYVPSLMGVSKAVLENVIFCHQEDSFWLFRDRQSLKPIFDDLFATSAFSKSHGTVEAHLRELRKALKEAKHRVDLASQKYEAVIRGVKQISELAQNQEKSTEELKVLNDKKTKMEAAIKNEDVEERLRIATAKKSVKTYQIEQLSIELEKSKKIWKEQNRDLKELLTMVENEDSSSLKEYLATLKNKLDSLQEKMANQENQKTDLQKENLEVQNQIDDIMKSEGAELLAENDIDEESIERLERKINELIKTTLPSIQNPDNQEPPPNNQEFLSKLKSSLQSLETSLKDLPTNHISELNTSTVDLSNLEKTEKTLLEELSSLNPLEEGLSSSAKKTTKHRLIETQTEELKKREEELRLAESLLEESNKDLKEHYKQISVRSELRQMKEVAQKFFEWNGVRQEIQESDKEIQEICRKYEKDMEEICRKDNKKSDDPVVFETVKFKNDGEKRELEKELDSVIRKGVIKDNEMETLQIKIEEIEKDLPKLENSLKNEIGEEVLKEEDLKGSYKNLKAEIKAKELELGIIRTIRQKYNLSLVEYSKETSKCKLCHQPFTEKEYTISFEYFQKNALKPSDPTEEALSASISTLSEKRQKIKQNKLKINQLETLRAELAIKKEEKNSVCREAGELRSKKMTLERKINEKDLINKDLSRGQELIAKKEKLEEKESRFNCKIWKGVSEKDFKAVEGLEEEKEGEMMEVFKQLQGQIKELEERIGKVKEEKRRVEGVIEESQRELRLLEDGSSLVKKRPYNDVLEERNKIKIKIEEKQKEIKEIKAKFEEQNAKLQLQINDIRDVSTKLEILQEELAQKIKAKESSKLTPEKAAERARLIELLRAHKLKLSRNSVLIDTISSQIMALISEKRTLDTDISFCDHSLIILSLKSSIIEVEDKEIAALKDKLHLAEAAQKALTHTAHQISRLEGSQSSLQHQIDSVYDNIYEQRMAEKSYAEAVLKTEIIRDELASLEKYNDSIDKGLAGYHQEQIQSINKTIALLWSKTYRGTDIQGIEVRAEVEAGSKIKNNFSYRVVFYGKDKKEMEMRGRSSMGQKVLASIVIRIALAKAFAQNASFLALDEPTTNLDRATVQSLAEFLGELIDQHLESEGLQLIIITHDYDFLKLFRRYSDNYNHVTKDANGFSKIVNTPHEKF